jgi:NhaP-type Na+/H+ or K+/H+ antiporter
METNRTFLVLLLWVVFLTFFCISFYRGLSRKWFIIWATIQGTISLVVAFTYLYDYYYLDKTLTYFWMWVIAGALNFLFIPCVILFWNSIIRKCNR